MVIENQRVFNALSYLEKRIKIFKSDCSLFDNTLENYNLLRQEVNVISELQEELRLYVSNRIFACPPVHFMDSFNSVIRFNPKMELFDAVNKHRKLNDQLFFV